MKSLLFNEGLKKFLLKKQQLNRQKHALGTIGTVFLKRKTMTRSRKVDVTLSPSQNVENDPWQRSDVKRASHHVEVENFVWSTEKRWHILSPAAIQPRNGE